MNKDKTNQEIIEGRNERILAADLNGGKRRARGFPQIPRRKVKGAELRIDGRLNRLAGTVHDVSSGDQPNNWRDRRNHSAGMSAAKRVLGNPSPRTPPKNRDRTIADSFNHGLEEAKRPTTPKRPIKQSKTIFGAGARGAVRGLTTPLPAGTSRTKHVLGQAVRNIARHVMDKFF